MGGGGVALYVREHWKFKELAVSRSSDTHEFENKPEYLIDELQHATHRLLVAVVYRRPKAALFDELFEALSSFVPHYKCLVITGDFNANILSPRLAETANLQRHLKAHSLYLASTLPTHHLTDRPIPAHTTLDLFLVNDPALIHSFSKSDSPFIAGHDFINLTLFLSLPKPPPVQIQTRQLSKLDHTLLHAELTNKLESLFSDTHAETYASSETSLDANIQTNI